MRARRAGAVCLNLISAGRVGVVAGCADLRLARAELGKVAFPGEEWIVGEVVTDAAEGGIAGWKAT